MIKGQHLINETDQVQRAYEAAVDAVIVAANCDVEDAETVVERIVELAFKMIHFNGDFNADHKH